MVTNMNMPNTSPLSITCFLCTHPSDTRDAAKHGLPLCHLAYRIGADGRLYRNGLGISVRGGLMSLSDYGITDDTVYSEELLRDIKRECDLRGYDGIVCDFERSPDKFLTYFVHEASVYFTKLGMSFYIPAAMGDSAPGAKLLISSAVTNGSCSEAYARAVARYTPERVALLYEPVCSDYVMTPDLGLSDSITKTQLSEIMNREHAVPYYSSELCAYYFTYKDGNNNHFILFDDENSMLKKLTTAKNCGFKEAFILYPDTERVLSILKTL